MKPEFEKLAISDIREYILKRLDWHNTYEQKVNYLRTCRKIYKEINDPDNEEVISFWKEIVKLFDILAHDIFLKSTEQQRYLFIEVDRLNSNDSDKLFELYKYTFAGGMKEIYSDSDKDYLIVDNEQNMYTWCENGDIYSGMYGEIPSQEDLKSYLNSKILQTIGEKL